MSDTLPTSPARAALPAWRQMLATRWPALALGVAAVVHFAATASWLRLPLGRLRHPLELGNVEGTLMDSIVRLANGQPLYPAPSLDFIPLAYVPGYPMVVAPLVRIFGPHLWTARLVSLAAALMLAVLIARIVWRETRSVVLTLAGPGLFFAGYACAGGTYDLVTPNSQMLMLAVLGMLVLRETRGHLGAAVAALLIAASFLSKQHGLLFGAAMLPWLAFHDRRRLATFAVALAAGAYGGFALLGAWLGPWFAFYAFDIPRHWSQFSPVRIVNFIGHDVFGTWGLCAAMIAVGAAVRVPPTAAEGAAGDEPARPLLWWFAWIGAIGAGLLATLDPFAYRQTLMPLVVANAIVAPIAIQRVMRIVTGATLPAGAATALGAVLLIFQYGALTYSARSYLPAAHGPATRTAFYERLRAVPGRVIIPYHGFYTADAGGTSSLHLLALDDIVRSEGNALLRRDPEYVRRMFAPLRSGSDRPWLLLDRPIEMTGDQSRPYWLEIAPGYRLVDSLSAIAAGLRPVAGLRDVPVLLYAPVED